jgi:hypothetical protein
LYADVSHARRLSRTGGEGSLIAKIPVLIGRLVRRTRFRGRLLWRWTRNYVTSERITAAFTLVLGAATTALVIYAIIQHYDIEKAIQATNRLAEAAEKHALEAKRLADEAKRSADTAVETAERQLRAYLGVEDIVFQCPLCATVDLTKPVEIQPEHIFDNLIIIRLHNGGQTPAYNVSVRDTLWETPFGQRLPKEFNYPDSPLSTNLVPTGSGTFNPGQKVPTQLVLDEKMISLIARAEKHQIAVFYYGHIDYVDVFGKQRSTPYCVEYIPASPTDPFANCPEHNTPEQGK